MFAWSGGHDPTTHRRCRHHVGGSHLALCTKAYRGWPAELFDKHSTGAHALLTPEATIESITYLIANPVEALAVRYAKDWPGAQMLPVCRRCARLRVSARRRFASLRTTANHGQIFRSDLPLFRQPRSDLQIFSSLDLPFSGRHRSAKALDHVISLAGARCCAPARRPRM